VPAARPPTPTLPEADPLSLVGASAMPTTPPPTDAATDLPTVIPPAPPEDPEAGPIQPSPIHVIGDA
jgi:hypothetical protein